MAEQKKREKEMEEQKKKEAETRFLEFFRIDNDFHGNIN